LSASKDEGAPNDPPKKSFKFYVCRDGELSLKDSIKVVEPIDYPDASFNLVLEARGNEFAHKILVDKAPKPEYQPLAVFTDKDHTYTIGGIGFRGINGTEMLIQSFFVMPEKKSKN